MLVVVDDAHGWIARPPTPSWFEHAGSKRIPYASSSRLARARSARSIARHRLPPDRWIDRASASGLLPGDGVSPEVADRLWHATDGNRLPCWSCRASSCGAARGVGAARRPLPAGAAWSAPSRAVRGAPRDAQRALLVAAVSTTDDMATVTEAAAELGAEASALRGRRGRGSFTSAAVASASAIPWCARPSTTRQRPSDRRAAHRASRRRSACSPEQRAWHLAAATLGPDEDVASALATAAEHALLRSGYGPPPPRWSVPRTSRRTMTSAGGGS